MNENSSNVCSLFFLAIKDIYKIRPCGICKFYSAQWNSKCISCDNSRNEYRPDFEWRGGMHEEVTDLTKSPIIDLGFENGKWDGPLPFPHGAP